MSAFDHPFKVRTLRRGMALLFHVSAETWPRSCPPASMERSLGLLMRRLFLAASRVEPSDALAHERHMPRWWCRSLRLCWRRRERAALIRRGAA